MKGVGAAFRELAAVFETLETIESETDAEITAATPVAENLQSNETAAVEVGMEIPLRLETTTYQQATITVQDAELTDGVLDITLQAAAPTPNTTQTTEPDDQSTDEGTETDESTPEQTTATASTPSNTSATDTPPTDSSTTAPHHTDVDETTTGDSISETAGPATDPETNSSPTDSETDGRGDSADTDSEIPSDSRSDDADPTLPPYRDPDRLQAVYETYDTFAEMTDALDVDVTAQTVRRYMIKHGIHEPASNTGSQTASILVDMDPDEIAAADPNTDTPPVEEASSPTTPEDETASPVDSGTHQPSRQTTDGGTPTSETSTAESPSSQIQRERDSDDKETLDGDDNERDGSDSDDVDDTATRERDQSTGTPAETVTAIADDEAPDLQGTTTGTEGNGKNVDGTKLEAHGDMEDDPRVPESALPDHLTLEELKAIVRDAKTLYDVQQQADLDRDRARELLQELNLLELVHGRLATRRFQDRTVEEINHRIRVAVQRERA